jgi:hypothetical protein
MNHQQAIAKKLGMQSWFWPDQEELRLDVADEQHSERTCDDLR